MPTDDTGKADFLEHFGEAGRGMRKGRDGFCKTVAYVFCVGQYPFQYKTLRTGLQIPSGFV